MTYKLKPGIEVGVGGGGREREEFDNFIGIAMGCGGPIMGDGRGEQRVWR